MLAWVRRNRYNPDTKGDTLVNRDGVKTVIGLLIIGLIIVATFLYGNHQRQAQLRHDEDLKRQQQLTLQVTPQASSTPQVTPKASTSPVVSSKPQPAVATPSANVIQGQGVKTTPSATSTPTKSVADTSTTPKTGPGEWSVALLALIGAGVYYRRSRRELALALISSRR